MSAYLITSTALWTMLAALTLTSGPSKAKDKTEIVILMLLFCIQLGMAIWPIVLLTLGGVA